MLFVAHWDWVLFAFRLPVARALREEGSDVAFVCPAGRFTGAFAAHGIRWIPWEVDRKGVMLWTELRSIVSLRAIYVAERPDLVQHFTLKPNLYGSLAARLARIPHVVNAFTGLGSLFGSSRAARVGRFLLVPLMRIVLKGPRYWTIVQNVDDQRRLFALRIAHPDRTELIAGSGVDTQLFHPAEKRKGDQIRVLLAARLLRDKGIFELVEAARILSGTRPHARIEIAGEPDPGNPSSISAEVLSRWIADGVVHFHGHVDDMPSLLRQVDIAVLPSSYPEGLNRFLLEAAATGLPLVATDIPGCRPIARPNENAILIPKHDPLRLAEALTTLLDDVDLRQRFGSRSRQIAVEEFELAKVVGEYLALYRKVMEP